MDRIYTLLLVSLLIIAVIGISSVFFVNNNDELPNLFVGVAVAHDNLEEIKELADEINPYANFFVIGSTGITYDIDKLDEACSYVYELGFYFLIYMHPIDDPKLVEIQRQWVETAQKRWDQYFLGLYAFDEPGGRQLDKNEYRVITTADNYTDATNKYVSTLSDILSHINDNPIEAGNLPLFTSDYALYWFDYKAGYDTVFAEFGWNYSRQLNVALCRGAATIQNKEWGVMITWTYNNPPYIESGPELYHDLVLAYENEAKYILIFDATEDYTKGILKQEHLDALKQFWQFTEDNPRFDSLNNNRVAYVLPKDYAYGFRGPEDKIWGLWEADSLSYPLSVELNKLLTQYGTKLDLIYDDGINLDTTYNKYIYWNSTTYNP